MSSAAAERYDVAILGAGFSGPLLATLLPAQGVRTLLVDRKSGPAFAVGESTIPRLSMLFMLLGARYGVPELGALAHFPAAGTTVHGIKRNFGFVHHAAGAEPEPRSLYQTLVPEARYGAESHLYRAEFDETLLELARRRGAQVQRGVELRTIAVDAEGAVLGAADGRSWRAEYLVDATGPSSPLARERKLRAPADALATQSRAIYAHVRGVAPYESLLGARYPALPRAWSQGTLHHIFDGGWVWVIPFDNHERSTNPRCSVGFVLESARHPRDGRPPEREIEELLERFPGIRRQLGGLEPLFPWVATDRLQYSSTACTAERLCLVPHAAGFIDPLFSRGLANNALFIDALAQRVIGAARERDWSQARFAPLEELQRELLRVNDRLVAAAFATWRHYPLWHAFVRVWSLGAFLDWTRLSGIFEDHRRTGDARVFDRLAPARGAGSLCPDLPGYDAVFDAVCGEVEAVARRGADADRATDRILEHLGAPVVPPVLGLGERERMHDRILGPREQMELLRWVRGDAPAEVRALLPSMA